MKILFLCGSLAPGEDGVGDYTRRLAGELIRQGNEASIIALNDRQIGTLTAFTQQVDGIIVQVLRLPNIMSKKERFLNAGKYIEELNPEWISLQYVPFSFQKKGLPFGLGKQLASISKGRKWHVMFHELWVGIDKEASLKHFLWGRVQRIIIQLMLKRIKFKVIHTQAQIYKSELSKLGFSATQIPLFGNIPILNSDKFLEKQKISLVKRKKIVCVFFGSIHPGAPKTQFVKELFNYSQRENKEIIFSFIGRCGSELDKWLLICNNVGIKTDIKGELSESEISEILSSADIGISTTPLLQIEKSGTVAAIREHSLPVICVSRSWTPRNAIQFQLPDGIWEFRNDLFDQFFFLDQKENSYKDLKLIVDEFTKQLVLF